MSPDPVSFALQSPTHLVFPSTRALADQLEQNGGRVVTRPTGHLIFYRPDGRRFLATDPSGHPLHECEWQSNTDGTVSLVRARIRLDWGQWIGLKPGGLINETRLNLAAKPGWRQITADHLRAMAAQALRVPIEEVRWFYRDEDFSIDAEGLATIRHRKDALYVLDKGMFESARFMACMGAMHWDHIDFLPVVELFKSLLPGTGSAVLELIRGLFDDQNEGRPSPQPLRYRGIPTYPSEAAFRLFNSCFTPVAPAGGNPMALFMDQSRSHQLTWVPAQDPPLRYFESEQNLCLTVQGGLIRKATVADDSTGLSYVEARSRRMAPLDRRLEVKGHELMLKDREKQIAMRLRQEIAVASMSSAEYAYADSPIDWRTLFVQGVPPIRPADAFGAVLSYPDDEEEIGELAAQPFVADFVQDLAEQDPTLGMVLSRAERVLIDNGDTVIETCIACDRPRDYTIRSYYAAYAQRQAQELWTRCAVPQQWEWLRRIRIVPASIWSQTMVNHQPYDVIYQWLPYASFMEAAALTASVAWLRQMLRPQGSAFVVGPVGLRTVLAQNVLPIVWEESVESLPTVQMHKSILPKARVKAGLTLFHITRP
jgi:hypothetical protein